MISERRRKRRRRKMTRDKCVCLLYHAVKPQNKEKKKGKEKTNPKPNAMPPYHNNSSSHSVTSVTKQNMWISPDIASPLSNTPLPPPLYRKKKKKKKEKKKEDHIESNQTSRRASLAADMLAPDLVPFDNHDTAAPALLVPPLPAPAAVPAAVAQLERAPRQRALWQQRARRGGGRAPLEAGRQRVGDGLAGEVAARAALGGRRVAPAAAVSAATVGFSVVVVVVVLLLGPVVLVLGRRLG